MGPVLSPKIADDDLIQGNTEITGNVEVTNFSVSSNVASSKSQQSTLKLAPKSSPLVKKLKAESKSPKKVQRNEVKLKLSPLKSKKCPKLKSPSPKVDTN